MSTPHRCDVFCKIVDNFGDIGVCWRLSQQLANEHGLHVRLLIDDYAVASQIIPTLSASACIQTIGNVTITPWTEALSGNLPDLVIENFSCGVPVDYAEQIAELQNTAPIKWVNLEYLSAETWVESCHLMPSQHPQLGFTKTFYYPGFSHSTGGLLREANLLQHIQQWQTAAAQRDFWQSLDLNPDTLDHAIKLSLFCYPQADHLGLIQALQAYSQPTTLFIPGNADSHLIQALKQQFDFDHQGQCQLAQLTLQQLPFLSQVQYDQLLAACDLNFVRGEDSWIRAIWAGKPFIWQPYIQTENTHLVKLEAFLAQYLQHADGDDETKALIQKAHLLWSNALPAAHCLSFAMVFNHLSQWQAASQQLSQHYHSCPSLTDQLMQWLAKPS